MQRDCNVVAWLKGWNSLRYMQAHAVPLPRTLHASADVWRGPSSRCPPSESRRLEALLAPTHSVPRCARSAAVAGAVASAPRVPAAQAASHPSAGKQSAAMAQARAPEPPLLRGARTDQELAEAIVSTTHETVRAACKNPRACTRRPHQPSAQVLVKFGSSWCQQCKVMLPSYVTLTRQVRACCCSSGERRPAREAPRAEMLACAVPAAGSRGGDRGPYARRCQGVRGQGLQRGVLQRCIRSHA